MHDHALGHKIGQNNVSNLQSVSEIGRFAFCSTDIHISEYENQRCLVLSYSRYNKYLHPTHSQGTHCVGYGPAGLDSHYPA